MAVSMPRSAASADAASALAFPWPAMTATWLLLGPWLRKAVPSATVINSGKPNVQNSDPGSRRNCLMRAALSGQSDWPNILVLPQRSAGQREKHVVQGGGARDAAGRLAAPLGHPRDERGQGDVRLGDGKREPIALGPDGAHPLQASERLGRQRRRGADLDQVLPPVLIDELGRRPQRDRLAVIDDGHPVTQALRLVHVVGREDDGLAARAQR